MVDVFLAPAVNALAINVKYINKILKVAASKSRKSREKRAYYAVVSVFCFVI